MLLSGKVNKYFLIVQEVMSPTFCASNCRDQKVKKLEGSERVVWGGWCGRERSWGGAGEFGSASDLLFT